MAIRWASGLKEAGQKARELNWNLLIHFFSPACEGCRAMDTRTYLDGRVEGEIAKDFIPLRADVSLATDLVAKCGVAWTPTLVFFDTQAMEHHRAVGFLTADDCLAHIHLAHAKIALARGHHEEAVLRFKHVADSHTKDELGAEALYWHYVVKFKRTGRIEGLKEGWKLLRARYPDSSWARKTLFLA